MDHLPAELWEQILLSTDQKTRFAVRGTCARLFNLIDLNNFMFYFTRSKQLPNIALVLSRYERPISVKFTKTIDLKPEAINHLSTLTNITNLSFDTCYSAKEVKSLAGLTRLTNLRSLSFGNPTCEQIDSDYSLIYTALHQLTILHIRSGEKNHRAVLNNKKNLLELDLSWTGDLGDFAQILKITCLTSLKLRQLKGSEAVFVPSLKNLDAGSFDPLTALESLHLESVHTQNIGHCVGLTKLVLKKVPLSKTGTHDWTTLTNLKHLEFHPRLDHRHFLDNQSEFNFLTALTNLEYYSASKFANYYWRLLPNKLTALSTFIDDVDIPCISNWTRFTNLQQFDLSSEAFSTINFDFLASFGELTRLEIMAKIEQNHLVPGIKLLTKLKELRFRPLNDIFNVPLNFSNLPNLEILKLHSMNEESFESLRRLSKLTQLSIWNGFPNVLDHLPLKCVTYLGVCAIKDKDFADSLVQITTLESLSLRFGTEMDFNDKVICSLTSMKHLTKLNLYNYHSLKNIARLTALQRLVTVKIKESEFKKLQKKMPFLYEHSLE